MVEPEPVESMQANKASGTSASDNALGVTTDRDIGARPPAERHERIFDTYAELAADEAFILGNDHDSKPLYHQFEAEAGSEFRWDYRKKQPGKFHPNWKDRNQDRARQVRRDWRFEDAVLPSDVDSLRDSRYHDHGPE